jgi:hypothetical protein
MSKKVISFSLWGADTLYNVGAIKNAQLALSIYPEWSCVFYCNSCVPQETIKKLKNIENTKVILLDSDGDFTSSLNRFLVVDDPEVEYAIFRDADSRLSLREKYAVDDWLTNNTDIHIMRDHPYHGWFIQAGMFGLKTEKFKNKIKTSILEYSPKNIKTEDQNFMSAYLSNMIKTNNCTVTVHDPFFAKKPFPSISLRGLQNGGVYFVGQQIPVTSDGVDDFYSNIHAEDMKLVNTEHKGS